MHHVETLTSKHNTPGREVSSSGGDQGVRSRGHGDFSSPKLDDRDKEILSLVRDRPSTLLSISDKTNIPFVECLFRARNLQHRGLLRKLSDTCNANGLYLYVAEERSI
jgi:hypothetical protein